MMTVKLKVESSSLNVQGSKLYFGQRSFIKAVKNVSVWFWAHKVLQNPRLKVWVSGQGPYG
jgi:hypothetical protein